MSPAEISSVIVAYSLAATRLIPAARALWVALLPAKLQWLPGAAIIAATTLEERLRLGVTSWNDLLVPVLLAAGAFVPGARSATHVAVTELAEKRAETSQKAEVELEIATGTVPPPPPADAVTTNPIPEPPFFPPPSFRPPETDEDTAPLSETPRKIPGLPPGKPVRKL